MSNLLDFHNAIHLNDGVAPLDFSFNLTDQMIFPLNAVFGMRVNFISLSDRIPNIYDAGGFYNWNNRRLQVSTDTVAPVTIQLQRGLYGTVETIAAAINDAINTSLGWWLVPTDPGLSMTANTVTDVVRVDIDSTKLNPAFGTSFRIDFRFASTTGYLAKTLGFSDATAYLVGAPLATSTFFSNQEVRLDTQGTKAHIMCNLVDSRRENGLFTRKLATIDFAGKNTISDNLWPPAGVVSPIFPFSGRPITGVQISVRTYDDYPMLFMNGGISGSITFGLLGKGYPKLS